MGTPAKPTPRDSKPAKTSRKSSSRLKPRSSRDPRRRSSHPGPTVMLRGSRQPTPYNGHSDQEPSNLTRQSTFIAPALDAKKKKRRRKRRTHRKRSPDSEIS